MGANLYGVSNPLPLGSYGNTIGTVDVVCTANTETNVLQWLNLQCLSPGFVYPQVIFTLAFSNGATPSSGILVGNRINSGADIIQVGPLNLLNVANANFTWSFVLNFTSSDTLWRSGTNSIQISVTSQVQPITVRASGTWALLQWFRGPDQ